MIERFWKTGKRNGEELFEFFLICFREQGKINQRAARCQGESKECSLHCEAGEGAGAVVQLHVLAVRRAHLRESAAPGVRGLRGGGSGAGDLYLHYRSR